MFQSILHTVWVALSFSLSLKSLKSPFAATRSAGIKQLVRIGWICLMLDTPKIKMHGTTAFFWKLWLSAYTRFQQGGKMTLLQIFFLLWGTSKVNMQQGGNCWRICLGVAESIAKRKGDTWANGALSKALSCMRCSSWSLNVRYLKIDGWQWPDFALADADPKLIPFYRGCTRIPESGIWPCEWFCPQMQLMIHAQRKGRMQIPCREATASHVNKEAFWVCSSQPTWAAVSMVYQML